MKMIRILSVPIGMVWACFVAFGQGANRAQDPVPAPPPEMGSHTTFTLQKSDAEFVVELSGLCLSAEGDFLWGVGDNGHLYKIRFDGGYECVLSCGSDLEGIVLDRSSGDLFVAVEPDRVCRLRSPYETKEEVFRVEEAAEMGNSGIEGIAWHGNNLYLGAQTEATLFEYSLEGKRIRASKSLRDIVPTISEIAGMCYEEDRDRLWVLDSNSNKDRPQYLPFTLYLFNGEATELLATYALGDFANWNPESVCVDRANGCVWIAEDCGDDHPSLLHKIEFAGL